jgi:hypothetical protein
MMEYLLQAGVKTKQCCVPYCKDNISKRHRFPKGDENIFNKWVNNVRHPKFEGLNKDQIYRSYYVCDRHFEEEFKVPGTKRGLRKDAMPSLFLISGMNSQLNYEDNII